MSCGWFLVDLDRRETFEFGWDTWLLARLSCTEVGCWLIEAAASGDRESWDFAWSHESMMGEINAIYRAKLPLLWDWIRAAPAQRTVPFPIKYPTIQAPMHIREARGIIVQSHEDYVFELFWAAGIAEWVQVESFWFKEPNTRYTTPLAPQLVRKKR